MDILFKTKLQISEQLVSYINEKADALNEFACPVIERIMDSESLNPQMHKYLISNELNSLLNDVKNDARVRMVTGFVVHESISTYAVTPIFRKLKIKIRAIFYDVLIKLDKLYFPKPISYASTIFHFLVGMLSVFKRGIKMVLLPIIIGYVALYMKKGSEYIKLK